jgi:hypothetical protein
MFTVADLHALPDDGLRCELIDGSLIVSPSATTSSRGGSPTSRVKTSWSPMFETLPVPHRRRAPGG